MAELTYRDAVARGIAQEMARDPDVIFFGEDVAKPGGVFKATVGLYEQRSAPANGECSRRRMDAGSSAG
jgi:pyruvate/2-oxoglutarate/acetoin dehydrogenase E1 component